MIRRSTWGDAQEPRWVDTLWAIALVAVGAVAVAGALALARWALARLPDRLPACPGWLEAIWHCQYFRAGVGEE